MIGVMSSPAMGGMKRCRGARTGPVTVSSTCWIRPTTGLRRLITLKAVSQDMIAPMMIAQIMISSRLCRMKCMKPMPAT